MCKYVPIITFLIILTSRSETWNPLIYDKKWGQEGEDKLETLGIIAVWLLFDCGEGEYQRAANFFLLRPLVNKSLRRQFCRTGTLPALWFSCSEFTIHDLESNRLKLFIMTDKSSIKIGILSYSPSQTYSLFQRNKWHD